MTYPFAYPHAITNFTGEELIFQELVDEDGIQKVIITNRIHSGAGPVFHVHFKQDECLTVVRGKMGYQIDGEEEQFLEPGQSVLFVKGQMHRFWNAGKDLLECKGWVKPAHSLDYFLTALYASMDKAGKVEGDLFDNAYLVYRYRSEYDVKVIPGFVKNIIFPIIVSIGRLLGKYHHFKHAPAPVK